MISTHLSNSIASYMNIDESCAMHYPLKTLQLPIYLTGHLQTCLPVLTHFGLCRAKTLSLSLKVLYNFGRLKNVCLHIM